MHSMCKLLLLPLPTSRRFHAKYVVIAVVVGESRSEVDYCGETITARIHIIALGCTTNYVPVMSFHRKYNAFGWQLTPWLECTVKEGQILKNQYIIYLCRTATAVRGKLEFTLVYWFHVDYCDYRNCVDSFFLWFFWKFLIDFRFSF